MPYRVDISSPPAQAFDLLVEMGALDIEQVGDALAAILPDGVTRDIVAAALAPADVRVSAATARDGGSVWLLSGRPVRAGGFLITSIDADPGPKTIRLTDSGAFGTGHHPTTALCLEALTDILSGSVIDRVLDIGTGSGILAIAALLSGVPRAVGLDIDAEALTAAGKNAQLNGVADRFDLMLGGAGAAQGTWPLVMANVLAAPLMEMAPELVRRIGSKGRLILSGIPQSLEAEVRATYRDLGIWPTGSISLGGWTAFTGQASW